ncbi:MAG: hypothetical protein FJX57_12570, partial [Alphaproteobacteria bacterium]|nr:hypothetical protein [Alphaproteobacteria bacterium]
MTWRSADLRPAVRGRTTLTASRRTALAALAGVVVTIREGWAQAPPLVAVVSPLSAAKAAANIAALRRGLVERGIAEGTGFRLLERYADGDPRRLADMLAEVVALRPRVLVVASSAGAVAARQATR